MKSLIIAEHEFKSVFRSPMAWTVLAILQLIFAYLFLTQVETFRRLQGKLAVIDNSPGLTDIVVTPLFGNAGIILLLVTPLLTMHLICGERRNKTLPLLLSAPISSTQLVIGKYLGVMGLLVLIVAMLTLMPLSLLVGGELDSGKFLANILALSLLVSAFAAAGLYLSTIAGHPVVAAMGSFGLLLLLWILDWSALSDADASSWLHYLSLLRHFQNLQTGLLSTVDVSYFLLFISTFLYATRQHLHRSRVTP